MEFTEDTLLRVQYLFVAASYAGAREPAVLLVDLAEIENRCLWDSLLGEAWEAWLPDLSPAELLVLDRDISHLGGLATGRFRLMRLLRDHLGENNATKKLVEAHRADEFFVVVTAGGTPTLATAPLPPREA